MFCVYVDHSVLCVCGSQCPVYLRITVFCVYAGHSVLCVCGSQCPVYLRITLFCVCFTFFVLEAGGSETSDTISKEFSKFADKICVKGNAQNI